MERSRMMIKAVVIGLGALIVLMTGALIIGVLDRLGGAGAPDSHTDGAVALPAGSRALSVAREDGTLSLLLDLASGSQAILTLDARTGEPLSTLELIPRP